MNKMELTEKLSEKFTFSKQQSVDVVDFIIATITAELARGGEVALTGFGSFVVKKRASRMGVNPKTGERIQILASSAPKFKPGKMFKDAVK